MAGKLLEVGEMQVKCSGEEPDEGEITEVSALGAEARWGIFIPKMGRKKHADVMISLRKT